MAYSFPYPFERVANHVESIQASPWVSPTPSSNADLILGYSPGGVDDRGRTVPQLPLFGYLITDPDSSLEKERMVFCSGVHANEVLAGYVLEGLVNWLVSDDPRAAALRREVEFYIYPMVNPDGRYAGYNRGGVQHPSRDTNRYWNETLYDDMDDIRQIGEAMKADTGSQGATWMIDFHSWTNTSNHFVFMNSPADESVFWQALTNLEPSMESQVQYPGGTNPTTRWFALNRLNADYGLVAETMFRPGEYPERFLAMGRRFGMSFFHEVSPENVDQPDTEVLMLVQSGHTGESSVRGLGAWIESEQFGKYGITYSADLEVDVLDSADSLSGAQMDVLESFDLIIMPRYGVGPSSGLASTDWNQVSTPILMMNPFMVGDGGRWGWVPADTETPATPEIQELVVPGEDDSVLFQNVDTSGGRVTMYRDPNSTMQVEADPSILSGEVLGWTDRTSPQGTNLEFPWIVMWEAGETPFFEGGNEVPAGRRMLFLGPVSNSPNDFTADGQQVLLNAISHIVSNPVVAFENWLVDYFTEAERGDPAVSGREADPDGDGVTNYLEYVLGGNPRTAGSVQLPVAAAKNLEVNEQLEEYLTLSFTRLAHFPQEGLRVEASDDLSVWEDEAILVSAEDNSDGTVTETYRDIEPLEVRDRRFLRLRVAFEE